MTASQFIIHTDGGSRGNPGPAATGIVVLSEDEVLHEFGTYLGVATNNEAEYTAVIEALKWFISSDVKRATSEVSLSFKLDSQLVVEQLSRRWKIKEPRLQQLADAVWKLLSDHHLNATFSYIPRSQNAAADRQVNLTLDSVQTI